MLNLDAEDEIAAGASYARPRAVEARIAALVPRLADLLEPGDVVIDPPGASSGPSLLALERAGGPPRGAAWCPTPGAMRAFSRHGVRAPAAPGKEVLERVLDRRFSALLGQLLPGAAFAGDLETARAWLAGAPEASAAGRWLVKRSLGFAGRGRRIVEPGPLRADDALWLEASFAAKRGVQIEPLVDRLADFALHGHVGERGEIALGRPTVQRCDARGAWQESAIASSSELSAAELEGLFSEAQRAGLALFSAGYFGPFGIDAFRFRDRRGLVRFLPRGEVNARYSMGWALGMGAERPDRA